MTDEPKEAASAAPAADGKPAGAILQEVVKAAEKEAATKVEDKAAPAVPAEALLETQKKPEAVAAAPSSEATATPRPADPAPVAVPTASGSRPRPLAQAAAVVVALGLGGASGWSASILWGVAQARPVPAAAGEANGAGSPLLDRSGTAFGIRRAEADTARLATDLRALKASLEALRDGVERARADQAGRLAQIGERLDRAGRAEQEVALKLAALSERLEGTGKIAERLDRIERQASVSAPAKLASATPEIQTGSIAPATPPAPVPVEAKAKPAVLEGWVLRDVDDGVALIEGRNQRLVEVGPGDVVPGTGGRVESIERRGKTWLVITSKGVIGTQR